MPIIERRAARALIGPAPRAPEVELLRQVIYHATAADIDAMGTAERTVLLAPPAGRGWQIISWNVQFVPGSTPWSAGASVLIGYGTRSGPAGDSESLDFTSATSRYASGSPFVADNDLSTVFDQPLVTWLNAHITGGDGDLYVTVWYALAE